MSTVDLYRHSVSEANLGIECYDSPIVFKDEYLCKNIIFYLDFLYIKLLGFL